MTKKKTNKNKRTVSIIVIVFCMVVAVYFAISFFKTQSEINAKEAELTALENLYESQLSENEELQNAINNTDEEELAKEYAREKGYVHPDERVYVDITPGS